MPVSATTYATTTPAHRPRHSRSNQAPSGSASTCVAMWKRLGSQWEVRGVSVLTLGGAVPFDGCQCFDTWHAGGTSINGCNLCAPQEHSCAAKPRKIKEASWGHAIASCGQRSAPSPCGQVWLSHLGAAASVPSQCSDAWHVGEPPLVIAFGPWRSSLASSAGERRPCT